MDDFPFRYAIVDRLGEKRREDEGKLNWFQVMEARGYGGFSLGNFLRKAETPYSTKISGSYIGFSKDLSQDTETVAELYENGWEVYEHFMQLIPEAPLILDRGHLLRRIEAPAASQKIETLEQS